MFFLRFGDFDDKMLYLCTLLSRLEIIGPEKARI